MKEKGVLPITDSENLHYSLGKEIWRWKCGHRGQVQLAEDGDGSTDRAVWRPVVCGQCSTGSDDV